MNTFEYIRKKADGFVRFAKLERILATLLAFIPLILYIADHGSEGFKSSISAYAYMKNNPQTYPILLTMASMLFIVNGVIKNKKWYNTALGLVLLGVVIFPCKEFATLHYIMAILFFGGSSVVIVKYTSKEQRWVKIGIVILITTSIALYKVFGIISLLTAEWISLGIISFHYIMESLGKWD
ncbi:MAG: hypothetical protein JXQ96_11505 [Cyclobacteriaceae bacterium]